MSGTVGEFLSDAWLVELAARLSALPPDGDVSATVQHVVTGVPGRKKVPFVVEVRDGRVAEVRSGTASDCSVTVTWDVAAAEDELAGRVTGDAAFMRGTKKVEGDYALYIQRIQPLLDRPAARLALAELAAATSPAGG